MSSPQDVISSITINNYLRSAWENAINNRPSIGMLKEKGNVRRATGGDLVYWPVRAGYHSAFTVADYEDVSSRYVPTKLHTNATLNWGEKAVFDALSKGQLRRNNGPEALVRFRDEVIPSMCEAMLTQGPADSLDGTGSLNYEFLNRDGDSYTGEGLPLYGLPSIFKFDTALDTDKEATVTSGATYAGLGLELDSLVGTVDGADSYGWTPRGFNTNFDWDGDATPDGGLTISNFALIMAEAQTAITFSSGNEMGRPDCCIQDRNHFNVGREFIGEKQQIFIQREDQGDRKWGLGNSAERYYHNGLYYYWDEQMPADTSRMLNFSQIWLDYLPAVGPISADKFPGRTSANKDGFPQDMFEQEINYNDSRRGITLSLTTAPQFRINPRYQAEIRDFT